MLVLKRKVSERILVGNDIIITVCPPGRDGHARIGIEAPEHIRVDREEVRERRDEERRKENA